MDEWDDTDQIDVDDSDLPSLLSLPRLHVPTNYNSTGNDRDRTTPQILRRCTTSQSRILASNCSPPDPPPRLRVPDSEAAGSPRIVAAPSCRRRISGPAGEVQARMHRELAVAEWLEEHEVGANKGMDRDDEGAGGEEFNTEPWISAMEFLGERGSGCSRSCSISSITTGAGKSAYRVDQVVGIVNSCKSNGLGGLYATLKDPTGTIGAFVHSKALDGSRFRDLAVGCVLVLKQVVVFPGRSANYLNITVNNVAKLISNESGPSQRVVMQSTRDRSSIAAPGKWTENPDRSEGRMNLGVESSKVVEHPCYNEFKRAPSEAVDTVVASQACHRKNMKNGKSRRTAGDDCVQGSILCQQGTNSKDHAAATVRGNELEVPAVMTARVLIGAADNSNRGFETICSAKSGANSCCGSLSSTLRSISSISSGLLKSQPLMINRHDAAIPAETQLLDGKKDMGVSGIKSSSDALQDVAAVAYPSTVLPLVEPGVIHGRNPTAHKPVTEGPDVPEWTDDQLAELFSDYPDADDMLFNFEF